MALKRFWLSFDLGIDGDYDSLYAWLDELKAVECGEGLASFEFEIGNKEPADVILGVFKRRKVVLRRKDRLYLIWRRKNATMAGRFIAGSRRRPPWAGSAVGTSEESEDVAN